MTASLADRFAILVGQDPHFRPRRLVTRSGLRVRGIFPSHRFSREMPWESSLERELVYRLEASWLVQDACTQPTTMSVPSLDGGRFRLHPGCAGRGQARPARLHRVQARPAAGKCRAPSAASGDPSSAGSTWHPLRCCDRTRAEPTSRSSQCPSAGSRTQHEQGQTIQRICRCSSAAVRARDFFGAQEPTRKPGGDAGTCKRAGIFRCAPTAPRRDAFDLLAGRSL